MSAGNVSDHNRASNVLSEMRFTVRKNPRYVMVDAGYSSLALHRLISNQYHARPVMRFNPQHKNLFKRDEGWFNTPEWNALYKTRQSVERAFSRLKGQRSLNHITTRGWRKVTAHCYLSLIAMQAGYRDEQHR